MLSLPSIRLLENSSSVPHVLNSVQNSLLLLRLHLSVVRFVLIYSHISLVVKLHQELDPW